MVASEILGVSRLFRRLLIYFLFYYPKNKYVTNGKIEYVLSNKSYPSKITSLNSREKNILIYQERILANVF